MLVLLPPSETKAVGGDGPPLALESLAFPALNPVRDKLIDALSALAADEQASLRALDLSPRQTDEVARNAVLRTSPTLPALERYTGVLYEALDIGALRRPALAKARRRLAVASALFGVLRGGDRVPGYRLSGDSTLPGVGGLAGWWRPALEPELAALDELVVDLRSGAYAALARIPDAVTVRVVTENARGVRTTVSHFNKAYKGKVAAALVATPREPSTVEGLLRILRRAGLAVQRTGPHEVELLTD